MKHSEEKIPIIPGKINIFVNKSIKFINYFCFGGITKKNNCFNDIPDDDAINVNIDVVSAKHFSTKDSVGLVNFSKHCMVGDGQIYYFRKFFFLKFGLKLKKIDNNNFCLSITPHYLYLVHLRIENLYPFGVHLSDLLMIETIQKGNLVLYGGAFFNTQSGKASIIMAPRGVGKTYSLLKLIENKTFKLISEEISYLDLSKQEANLICVPNTILHISKNSGRIKFFDLFSIIFRRRSLLEFYGLETFSKEGVAQRIYLLENSKNDSIERAPVDEENFRKIMTIQRLQFSYYYNPLLRAYSYYGNLDLDYIYKKEESLLISFFQKIELFIVRASSLEKFSQLIEAKEKSDLPPLT